MTARAIGDVLAGRRRRADERRTLQPVHRRSYHQGERECREWQRFNRFPATENNARMRALEELEREERTARAERQGTRKREASVLKHVYRLLLRLRGKKTGQLDPSYDWIAKQVDHAPSAVKRAMRQLEELGFLRWIRRTQRVEDPARPDQYVEQISNAYVLELTRRAADLVRRILRRPTPEQQRRLDEQRRDAEHRARSTGEVVARAPMEIRSTLEAMHRSFTSASPSTVLNPALKKEKGE